MKKYFYLMSLMFCMTIGSMVFVACGDDDDSSSGGNSGNNMSNSELVGKWTSKHSGTGSYSTQDYTETFEFTSDGKVSFAFNYDYQSNNGRETGHNESSFTGTYTFKNNVISITVKEAKRWDRDKKEVVTDPYLEPDSVLTFPVTKAGNGLVIMSYNMGGVNIYTKSGATFQINYGNHELVGAWKGVEQRDSTSSIESYYKFNADGTAEYYELYIYPDSKGGRIISGYWVLTPDFTSIWGRYNDDVEQSVKGATYFSIVDYYERWWDEKTNNWSTDYNVRSGGHPLMYQFKDGKLYIGMIGMQPDYFYSTPLTKQ